MSYLGSVVDVKSGWPNGSALSFDFVPANDAITEGTVVKVVAGTVPGKAVVTKHTSAAQDHPWLVIRGKESFDSQSSKSVTCLRMRTGFIFEMVLANLNPSVGSYLWADNGTFTLTEPENKAILPVGQVIEFNSVTKVAKILS